jgi:hypothetical protein
MKNILFFVACVLSTLSVSAQTDHNDPLSGLPSSTKKWLDHVHHLEKRRSVSKTTGIQYRLSAFSYYPEGTGVPMQDSGILKYTGPHGGITTDYFQYNSPSLSLTLTGNSLPGGHADSMYQGSFLDGSNPEYRRGIYLYDSGDNMTDYWLQIFHGGAYQDSLHYVYSYNSQNKLATEQEYAWLPGTAQWLNTAIKKYVYNAQGLLTSDSSGMPSDYCTVYSYDANSNLIDEVWFGLNGGNWDTAVHYVHTYYPNNALKTSTDGLYKDSIGYSATGMNNYELLTMFDPNTGWQPFILYIRTFNASDFPAAIFLYDGGLPISQALEALYLYDYDINGFLIHVKDSMVNVTGGDLFYYYDSYNDGLAVNEILSSSAFTIYPNPAGDVLNIKKTQPFSGNIDIEVFNAAGQPVYRATASGGKDEIKVPLTGMLPGNYWIRIQNGGMNDYTGHFLRE